VRNTPAKPARPEKGAYDAAAFSERLRQKKLARTAGPRGAAGAAQEAERRVAELREKAEQLRAEAALREEVDMEPVPLAVLHWERCGL
jgi:hypothetical protein